MTFHTDPGLERKRVSKARTSEKENRAYAQFPQLDGDTHNGKSAPIAVGICRIAWFLSFRIDKPAERIVSRAGLPFHGNRQAL